MFRTQANPPAKTLQLAENPCYCGDGGRKVQVKNPFARGRSADVFVEGDRAVKLFHPDATASVVARELQAQQLARCLGISTPTVFGIIERDKRQALVMEYVDGLPMLARFRANPAGLLGAFTKMGQIHARIHQARALELPTQKAFLARHITAARLPPHLYESCLLVLEELPTGEQLCHGDMHPGNLLWPSEAPCVIDWGTACKGSPAADVARTLLLLSSAPLPAGLRLLAPFRRVAQQLYLYGYRRVSPMPRIDLERWWLPVAAARLAGNHERERPALLSMIERSCLHRRPSTASPHAP